MEDPNVYPPAAIIPRLRQLIDRGGHPLESHFSFHGLVGFLPLPKLHLVLITKKQKVGCVSSRWIYGILEWTLMPLAFRGKKQRGGGANDREAGQGAGKTGKYRELINNHIDLTKDFYFSYLYDLSHSLQHNLSQNPLDPPTLPTPAPTPDESKDGAKDPNSPLVKSVSTPQFPSRASPLPSAGLSPADTVLLKGLTSSPGLGARPLSPPLSRSTSFTSNPWANLESSFAAAANAPAASNGSPNGSSVGSPSAGSPTSPASPPPGPTGAYLPPLPPRTHAYNEQFLWNYYLVHPFLSLLPNSSYWLIPLVHGFFAQQLLRHNHLDVLVTLMARRSRHYAGTRYIKRGVNAAGHVANEVESEQLLEVMDSKSTWFNTGASYASVVLMRGSIPLYWWQENVQSLKPNIVVAPSQDNYAATRLHIDDLVRRYGPNLDLLSLIKKEERHPQETRLGYAYTAAVAWLREAYKDDKEVRVDYQTYDFINCRAAKANVLRDVRKLVAPAVEAQGVFSHVQHVETEERKEGGLVESASDLLQRERRSVLRTRQSGVVRINCVDCLDRTNVAQFCVGKAAMRLQLQQLGLVAAGPGEKVWPELLQILQRFFTQHGDRIAQQYAGSGAMHRDALYDKEKEDEDSKDNSDLISGGVGQATRDRLTAERDRAEPPTSPQSSVPGAAAAPRQKAGAGLAHNAISFAKRYYANNLTDVEKQQAINVFLGHFIPTADRGREVWDEDASAPLAEFDAALGAHPADFFFLPYNPNFLVDVRPRKRRTPAKTIEAADPRAPRGQALSRRFGAFFDEKYNPTKLTSLERELSKDYQRPVYVGGGLVVETAGRTAGPSVSPAAGGPGKEGTPVSQGSTGSVEPSPLIGSLSSSQSSATLPPLPLLQDDSDPPSTTYAPASPRSRTDSSLMSHTPPHSPSPQSLSRHNSIDQPSPSHSSAPPSPSHALSPLNAMAAGEGFSFNLSAGITSAPHPGHKSSLAQANAVANKVGAATKSFFTKGLKTFGVHSRATPAPPAGAPTSAEKNPLHRVKSTGSVHGGGGPAGAPPTLALPVSALAASRSQDFSFLDAGNAVTLAHASGAAGNPMSPSSASSAGSPRKGLPPVHGNPPLSSSQSFTARSMSPQGSAVPRDTGSGMTSLDDLIGGVSSLPSLITQDSAQHQQILLADRILRQEALEREAAQAALSNPAVPASVAVAVPAVAAVGYEGKYLVPRNDDEVFEHYLDTRRLYRPVSIEIPWTETWQLQLAGSSPRAKGIGMGKGEAGEGVVGRGAGAGAVGGTVGGQKGRLDVSVVGSVAAQLREEVAGEGSLVTSTIEGVEGASSAAANAELEEKGIDPLAQSTEVPGDSDEAAVAKLAGEIDD